MLVFIKTRLFTYYGRMNYSFNQKIQKTVVAIYGIKDETFELCKNKKKKSKSLLFYCLLLQFLMKSINILNIYFVLIILYIKLYL